MWTVIKVSYFCQVWSDLPDAWSSERTVWQATGSPSCVALLSESGWRRGATYGMWMNSVEVMVSIPALYFRGASTTALGVTRK